MCRGREVSEATVTMGPFSDNRADNIRKVPARELLVNTGTRASVNSIKVKWVVRLETRVCFCITRLMKNQIKSRKRATSQKTRQGDRDLSDTWTDFIRFTMLDEKTIQARLPVARDMESHVRSIETKREAIVGYRKTEA